MNDTDFPSAKQSRNATLKAKECKSTSLGILLKACKTEIQSQTNGGKYVANVNYREILRERSSNEMKL
jgi:hypothetical protein